MNYIELFAGCGGLSLGLEAESFQLVFANELSAMAGETFAYNFFKEDLANTCKLDKPLRSKWLSSHYDLSAFPKRLREDPRSYPALNEGCSDLQTISDLNRSLVIGNIAQLNQWLLENRSDLNQLRNSFGRGEIDLVSGGPPCQSFSMAGMRQLTNVRNRLPWEFAKFVQLLQPKMALLENVSGILKPFTLNNNRYYAWFEVAKTFASIDYIPLCLHINAKYVGVAQNRPRFIMLALRRDIYLALKPTLSLLEQTIFRSAEQLQQKIKTNEPVEYGELQYFDIDKPTERICFEQSFLKDLLTHVDRFNTVQDAIDDLRSNEEASPQVSDYVSHINKLFQTNYAFSSISNHELRRNNELVQRRFRIYQVLNEVDKDTRDTVKRLIKGESQTLSDLATERLLEFRYLDLNNQKRHFSDKTELIIYLLQHQTKKQTQKALFAHKPAPAAMSIADDICHYHPNELRTLTVREMARIQSFPDSFVFRSKITTGGKMRQFEVPQYTQVGNAVPPLLGKALGRVVQTLLERASQAENKKHDQQQAPLLHELL